jgi:transmembrane sensor
MARSAARLEAEAAAWLAKRDAGQWDAGDEAALDQWRGQSTAHHLALLRLETAWCKADRLRALAGTPIESRPDIEDQITTVEEETHGSYRRWGTAIAASIALFMVSIPAWRTMHPAAVIYSTQVGGFQRLPLADGSRVELNTDSRLEVAFQKTQRRLVLVSGEAFFDVAHDRSRPFVVDAGPYTVTAVGTAFSVRRDNGGVSVIVSEGRVRVDRNNGSNTSPIVFVTAGQRIDARPAAAIAVERTTPMGLEEALSWREGMLAFEEEPLANVAAEFNRYNRRQLIVDPAVANVKVSGTFRANNVEGFTRLLDQGFDVSALPRGEHEILLRPG